MDQPNAGAEQSGNPSGGNAQPGNGSDGQGGTWASGLSEGNRAIVEQKGWKSGDDVISGYTNLEKVLSETARVPGKDAKPEEWQKLFERVRPEKPEGYEFKLPDKLPADFAYDKAFADEWKQWGHEAGLHPMQAQFLHDKYVGKMGEFHAQSLQAAEQARLAEEKAIGDAHASLVKDWGPPETAGYKENVGLADRLVSSEPGLMDALKSGGFLTQDGDVKDPVIMKAFAKWGKQLMAEDSLSQGDPAKGVNPWHADTINLSLQSQVLKSDPQRAKEMIIAAGKDPKRWGL